MRKIYIILLVFLGAMLIISILFVKRGNTISEENVVDYILNISSYETKIEVEVISNKNTNRYILKQRYIDHSINEQEVLEPNNIAGTKIIKDNNQLKIENTQLDLSVIYENYNYLADNCLDLYAFIEDYKNNKNSQSKEIDGMLIMSTAGRQTNKYIQDKMLYVDLESRKPIKMEIKDANQKSTVNILYNEVKIN